MALTLKLNEPVLLALTRPDPKRFENVGRPDSYMYSVVLEDGTNDKIFVTSDCSQAIQEMQIRANQPFAICRRKTPQRVEYFEVVLQTHANPVPVPQEVPAAATTATRKPVASASTSQTRASSIMGAALIAAIDAATLAQEYAASKGIAVEFRPEDVRAIANTLYIQACKDPLFQERVA